MMQTLTGWRLIWQHLLFLAHKELLALVKDPRMKFMLIMPPIIQGLIFGYAANYNLDEVPYALVDSSHSAASRDLIAHMDASPSFRRVATLGNVQEVSDYVDSGEIIMAVVIPKDFASKLERGETAPVQVLADGRNSSIAGIASGYVNAVVAQWNLDRAGGRSALSVETRTWYNPNQLTRWNFLPGLIGMISFVQVILLGGMSVAKEREEGTFDQLLVTPLTQTEILLGKAIPPILVGLFQSTALFLIALLWFRVPFQGSLGLLYLSLLLFAVSATGIGLSISSLARNMQQVLVYVLVFLMPMVLLSGIATPVANMPEALQIITYIDPMRFALDAIRRIYAEGAGFMEIWPDFVPMLAIAAVTLPLAGWLFRRHAT